MILYQNNFLLLRYFHDLGFKCIDLVIAVLQRSEFTEAIQRSEGALREGGFLYGFDWASTTYSSSLSQSTNMHVKLMDDSQLVI